jgi:hypothetical protein
MKSRIYWPRLSDGFTPSTSFKVSRFTAKSNQAAVEWGLFSEDIALRFCLLYWHHLLRLRCTEMDRRHPCVEAD